MANIRGKPSYAELLRNEHDICGVSHTPMVLYVTPPYQGGYTYCTELPPLYDPLYVDRLFRFSQLCSSEQIGRAHV